MSKDLDLLCDLEDVAAQASHFYQRSFTAKDPAVIAAAQTASDQFRLAVRHPVTQRTNLRFTLDGNRTRYLRLPVVNPQGVTVSIAGNPVHVRGISTSGMIELATTSPDRLGAVTVTVETSGWETIPPTIQAVVTTQAVITLGQVPGVQQISLGGAQVTYGSTSSTGVSQTWADAVATYALGGRA